MMKKSHHPPKWATKILTRICAPHLLEEIYGDLLEEYQYQLHKNGPGKAYWDYVFSVIGFIRPFAIRKKTVNHHSPLINLIMLKNYFTTALRNVARYKTYSAINLAGLTLGLACSMLIFQYVTIEKGADGFHENADQMYRVAFKEEVNGQVIETFSQIFYGAGEAFAEEIPEVENFARLRTNFFQEGPTISHVIDEENKRTFKDIRSIIVDTTFLSVFSFPLLSGNAATALQQPRAILITESMADKMFGQADPMGKIIKYALGPPESFVVTGILKNVPTNSHIQFDVVVPMHSFQNWRFFSSERLIRRAWTGRFCTTYISVRPNSDIKKIETIMTDIVDRNTRENRNQNNSKYTAVLQPMNSLYFDRETNLGMTGGGSVQLTSRTGNAQIVYFLTVIGIIALSIAFISYVNLSTIRSLDRAKEVGVRKVLGAERASIKWQFFFESTLMNFTAFLLALLLLLLLAPTINSLVQIEFTWISWLSRSFLILFGSVFLLGVVLSGWYPAFVLSSFQPIAALKGKAVASGGRSTLRKILIVMQYTPAIALLVCTTVVYQQLNYMQNKDIGLDMSKLITVRSPRLLSDSVRSLSAELAFKNEVMTLSSVATLSFAGNQAGRGLNGTVRFQTDNAGPSGILDILGTGVDHNFINVYGLELLAGEPFREGDKSRRNVRDPNWAINILVNETAVRSLGFKRNEDAVGQIIRRFGGGGQPYNIQGVLEDFNWSSLHNKTQPVMFWIWPQNRFMTIKLNSNDFNSSLMEIKAIYDKLFPADVFHYEMTDAVYKDQYKEDEKFANLFGIFSGVSILIVSLGLFGLSAFTIVRRSKEVGIRKVLGASVNNIVRLLSREFLLLVIIAFILACPIAWMAMSSWLENFAFRIDLTASPFIAAGLVALLIALITVSWKTFNTATTNPVNVLKNE